MGKTIKQEVLTDTLTLTECTDGFWLHDTTRGMNLSMRAKTSQQAFIEALGYYQGRLSEVEKSYYTLQSRVNSFIESVSEDEDED